MATPKNDEGMNSLLGLSEDSASFMFALKRDEE